MQTPMIAAVFFFAFGPPAAELEPQVAEILEESCTMCHDSSDEDLNLEELSPLIGAKATTGAELIKPGDPNASYLYLKMLGAEGIEGDSMPLGDDPLPDEQLNLVRDWIAALPTDQAGDGDGDAGGGEPPEGEGSGSGPTDPPKRKDQKGKYPFHGTHQIGLQTTTTLGKKSLEFRVHHRFGRWGRPFRDGTYFGLASGVIMSLGVSYGIVDGLDAMVRWSNQQLDWELGMKYIPVRQEDGKPLSFGAYASFEALSVAPDVASNRFTGNFQLLLSRLWFERWSTQLTAHYSMLTNHASVAMVDLGDGPEPVTDTRGTLGVGVASTVWLGKKKKHGIDLEYNLPIPIQGSPAAPFYYNGGDANPNGSIIGSWSVGWSVRTGLHFFQVFVSNTRSIHSNLFAAGGDTTNPFNPLGDFFVGFNLSRKWKFK